MVLLNTVQGRTPNLSLLSTSNEYSTNILVPNYLSPEGIFLSYLEFFYPIAIRDKGQPLLKTNLESELQELLSTSSSIPLF